MADPIPFYAAPIPTGGEMPPGAIPVRVYGLDASGGGGGGVPPIESDDLLILSAYVGQAGWIPIGGPGLGLLDMDYGLPGQVLAMNSDGDGLEWVNLPTVPTEPTEPQ